MGRIPILKVHSHQTTPSPSPLRSMGKMGMQPILPVTVLVKKIKGAAHQCYGHGDGVVRCEQTFSDSS